MPQNTGRYRIVYWLVGDPAEIHTATQRLAASVDTAVGALEDGLRALVASTANSIQSQINTLSSRITDARNVRTGTAQGSSTSAQTVQTNGVAIGGLSFDIPAGYGASYVVVWDVTCTSYVAGSLFVGTVNLLDRRSNPPGVRPIQGQGRFLPNGNGAMSNAVSMNTVPAEDYARTLQPVVSKVGNGGYEVTPSNCRIQWTLTRTGSL